MKTNRMHRFAVVSAIMLSLSVGLAIAVPAKKASDSSLPQVLIIGDSISIGYMRALGGLLEGKAIVRHNPGNAGHTGMGLANIKRYIAGGKWDVREFTSEVQRCVGFTQTYRRFKPLRKVRSGFSFGVFVWGPYNGKYRNTQCQ
jgi:hypothetical protein